MVKKIVSLKAWTLDRTWPFILAIGGVIGLFASLEITLDKINLLANPKFVPNCDINPIISCGSVMNTPQASVFGIMNSLIGVMAFAIVMTIGFTLLAGASYTKIKRWFWVALQLGTIFGLGFVHWLIFQTIYRIGALCPYCMVVWSVMIPIFWYTTLYNLRSGVIATPKPLKGLVVFLQKHHGDVIVVWFLAILTMILTHFWYYWKTLI
ncbi:MAG: vitamin K epoxide reductase family protein [Candidatus Saccharimonadales bacterium]